MVKLQQEFYGEKYIPTNSTKKLINDNEDDEDD